MKSGQMKVLRKHLFTITSSLLLVSLFYRSPQLPESSNESLEIVSLFELRRSLLLNHCTQKKKSLGGSPQGLPKLPLKNLHMVRNLPGDLVFCLLKKGGSTSLNQFFLSNLQPSDEMTWIQPVEEAMQTKILESRSTLRVIRMMMVILMAMMMMVICQVQLAGNGDPTSVYSTGVHVQPSLPLGAQ